MKKSKFTEHQIAFALRQAETGTKVKDVIRQLGITEQTFYRWKRKYGGLGPSELRKLRLLEEENKDVRQSGAGRLRFQRLADSAFAREGIMTPGDRRTTRTR